jgi:hypothetical protein
MTTVLLFALAILSLALVPIASKLVRLRVRFFRWLHWNWAVRVLEEHFESWVVFFRIVLLGLAAVLFLVGVVSALS